MAKVVMFAVLKGMAVGLPLGVAWGVLVMYVVCLATGDAPDWDYFATGVFFTVTGSVLTWLAYDVPDALRRRREARDHDREEALSRYRNHESE